MSVRDLSLALLFVAFTVAAKAQSESVCTPGVFGYNFWGVSTVKNIAYTAKTKSTIEERLGDGNTIRGFVHTQQARDSSGRTLSEQPQSCHLDENGKPQVQMFVSLYDPIAKTTENWQVGDLFGDKVVRLLHSSTAQQSKKPTPEEIAARRKAAEHSQPPRSEFKTEDLGTRTIAGTEASGSRSTRTIPSGEEGNELPLLIVTETWRSKDLGMVMMTSTDDPRYGKRSFEIEELSRTEPDAALFLPPAGYKVIDQNPPTETLAKQ